MQFISNIKLLRIFKCHNTVDKITVIDIRNSDLLKRIKALNYATKIVAQY